MTTAVRTFLLEDCFFVPLDQGVFTEETPLFTGSFEGSSLPDILCHRFGTSPEEAEFEIAAARMEVEL
jgi:hypothetical protein